MSRDARELGASLVSGSRPMRERARPIPVDRDDVVALKDVVDLALRPDTAYFVHPDQIKRARRALHALDTYANQLHPEPS